VVVYGRVKRGRKRGTKTLTETDQSTWTRVEMPELRIVSDGLWAATHARMTETAAAFLRRNGKLAGQVENLRGKYLLSGFLACGICEGKLIAHQRGRNLKLTYICANHLDKGDVVWQEHDGRPDEPPARGGHREPAGHVLARELRAVAESKAENEQERVARPSGRASCPGSPCLTPRPSGSPTRLPLVAERRTPC
jgi:hypothetical protein